MVRPTATDYLIAQRQQREAWDALAARARPYTPDLGELTCEVCARPTRRTGNKQKRCTECGWAVRILRNARERQDTSVSALEVADLLRSCNGSCPCCGDDMSLDAEGRNDRPTLEQIFPGEGYHPGRVAIICGKCNRRLLDTPPQEMRRLADYRERLQRLAKAKPGAL